MRWRERASEMGEREEREESGSGGEGSFLKAKRVFPL